MAATGGGPDFITIDGGEGGTGAAPLAFSDHVALPFKLAFAPRVPAFARAGIAEDIVFIGAGRSGFPDAALHALAPRLRHDQRRPRGDAGDRLHPGPALPHRQLPDRRRHPQPLVDARPRSRLKHARAANYIVALRAELLALARACGARHPALIDPDRIEVVSPPYAPTPLRELFGTSRSGRSCARSPNRGSSELVGRPASSAGARP